MCFMIQRPGPILAVAFFSTVLFWTGPSIGKAADAGPGIPPVLARAQMEIQRALDGLDASLAAAARDLGGEENLHTPRVHSILGKLCSDAPRAYVVDCCTVDPAGKIAAIEPEVFKSHEGADIGKQEQVVRLRQTRRPVLSLNMPMVEGFEAVDLEWPVVGAGGAFKGSVSMLIKPEALIDSVGKPLTEGLPVNIWIMQKNGLILYDVHKDEIGRDLFSDPLFKPFGELLALGRIIAAEPAGSGFYEYSHEGSADPVKKRAHWATVGLHGADWRLVMVQVLAGAKEQEAVETDSVSVRSPLRALARSARLRESLAAGDEDDIMRVFERFYRANPVLYSIAWVDATGVVRLGYPPENSLRNYNMRTSDSAVNREFMQAVDSRKETSLKLPLLEGDRGVLYLVPVVAGERYLGTVYAIRRKAGKEL